MNAAKPKRRGHIDGLRSRGTTGQATPKTPSLRLLPRASLALTAFPFLPGNHCFHLPRAPLALTALPDSASLLVCRMVFASLKSWSRSGISLGTEPASTDDESTSRRWLSMADSKASVTAALRSYSSLATDQRISTLSMGSGAAPAAIRACRRSLRG